ncbi:hypothetical protein BUE80_DR005048 [Diplocarpon rosae]|nr:hypothetical protein BUE80_DR005048 [Diplocarpon rosae]
MKLSHLLLVGLSPSVLARPALAVPTLPPSADNVVRIADSEIKLPAGQERPTWDGKYFHEPGGGDDLGHYDLRYYSGAPVTYEQRGETLYHLIRSYLSVFRERNIETWVAHGTLLGWWWNGRIMPWDWDLDTQNVIDARWIDVRNGLFIDITGLSETNPQAQPGVWSCKNYHRYRTSDLYPLRETEFEGVPALVPYSFDRILKQEYSAKVLTNTRHEG